MIDGSSVGTKDKPVDSLLFSETIPGKGDRINTQDGNEDGIHAAAGCSESGSLGMGFSEIQGVDKTKGRGLKKHQFLKQLGSSGKQSLYFGNKTADDLQEIIEGIPYPDQFSMTSISNSTHSHRNSTPQRKEFEGQKQSKKQLKCADNSAKVMDTQESEEGGSSAFHWSKTNMVPGNSTNVFPQVFAPSIELSNENSILLRMGQTGEGRKLGLATFGGIFQRPSDSDDSGNKYSLKKEKETHPKRFNNTQESRFFKTGTSNDMQEDNFGAYKGQITEDGGEEIYTTSRNVSPNEYQVAYASWRHGGEQKSQISNNSALEGFSNRQSRLLGINNFHSNSNIKSNSDMSSNLKFQDQSNRNQQHYGGSMSQAYSDQENSMMLSNLGDNNQNNHSSISQRSQLENYYQTYPQNGQEGYSEEVFNLYKERDCLAQELKYTVAQVRFLEQENNNQAQQIEDLNQNLRLFQHKDNGDIRKLRGKELEREKMNSKRLQQSIIQKNEKIQQLLEEMVKIENSRQALRNEVEEMKNYVEFVQGQTQSQNHALAADVFHKNEVQKLQKQIEELKHKKDHSKNSIQKAGTQAGNEYTQKDSQTDVLRRMIVENISLHISDQTKFANADLPTMIEMIRSQFSELIYQLEGYQVASKSNGKEVIERVSTIHRLKSENSKLKEDILNLSMQPTDEDKLTISHFNSTYGQDQFKSRNELQRQFTEIAKERESLAKQRQSLLHEREQLTNEVQIKLQDAQEIIEKGKQSNEKLLTEKQQLEEELQKKIQEGNRSLESQIRNGNALRGENEKLKQKIDESQNTIKELERKLLELQENLPSKRNNRSSTERPAQANTQQQKPQLTLNLSNCENKEIQKKSRIGDGFERVSEEGKCLNCRQFEMRQREALKIETQVEANGRELCAIKEKFIKEQELLEERKRKLDDENLANKVIIEQLRGELKKAKEDILNLRITPEMLSNEESLSLVQEILSKAVHSQEIQKILLLHSSDNDLIALMQQLLSALSSNAQQPSDQSISYPQHSGYANSNFQQNNLTDNTNYCNTHHQLNTNGTIPVHSEANYTQYYFQTQHETQQESPKTFTKRNNNLIQQQHQQQYLRKASNSIIENNSSIATFPTNRTYLYQGQQSTFLPQYTNNPHSQSFTNSIDLQVLSQQQQQQQQQRQSSLLSCQPSSQQQQIIRHQSIHSQSSPLSQQNRHSSLHQKQQSSRIASPFNPAGNQHSGNSLNRVLNNTFNHQQQQQSEGSNNNNNRKARLPQTQPSITNYQGYFPQFQQNTTSQSNNELQNFNQIGAQTSHISPKKATKYHFLSLDQPLLH